MGNRGEKKRKRGKVSGRGLGRRGMGTGGGDRIERGRNFRYWFPGEIEEGVANESWERYLILEPELQG